MIGPLTPTGRRLVAEGDRREVRLPELGREPGRGLPLPRSLLLGALILLAITLVAAAMILPRAMVPMRASGTGWVEPARTAVIRAPEASVVTQVLVAAGATVSVGQPLVRLEVSPNAEDRREVVLRAPSSGVVQASDPRALAALAGRSLMRDELIIQLVDPSVWEVHFFVPALAVRQIGLGDTVRVEIEALQGLVDDALRAEVTGVGTRPSAAPEREGLFEVVAALDLSSDPQVGQVLRTGFDAQVELVTGRISLAGQLRRWVHQRFGP